ncbi:predicted protein [Naegleria gruberi]|uniref:Predicted protein n=1 Tax=Naegleria gruberi TaxID=5762 RepID=D2VH59_NAEGR|nr:uncharacterized protein NAEGRDRAFT_68285 [Naegleria gruberi]EFC43922.1 predicted protein [Naegleria gruberi]|eukprot:XP_002676666.1 predicted protein [Naegleria gruberi strain NEG-M]
MKKKQSYIAPTSKAESTVLGHQVSDEDVRRYREIFQLVDRDGGGSIEQEELGTLMRTLGLKPSEEEIQEMMKEADADNSGAIDFEEFVAVMSRSVQSQYTVDQYINAFKTFETEDCPYGVVRTKTLEHALTTYGDNPITLQEATELLANVDPENTGKINYINYINMLAVQNGGNVANNNQ